MNIPGVKNILACPADRLPADLELKAMAGADVSITGITYYALKITDGASLELSDSNGNYGSNRHAALKFVTLDNFNEKKCAFIVITVSGAVFLIGNAHSVPAIAVKDNWDAPAQVNRKEISVELNAPLAWCTVQNPAEAVEYDTVRDITKPEIDGIIGKLK